MVLRPRSSFPFILKLKTRYIIRNFILMLQ